MNNYIITALIVVYNDTRYVKHLCESLLTFGEANAIVVVDNSDKFDYKKANNELFNFWHNNVHYLKSEKNGGYAAGNNIGIKYIQQNILTDYIWVLNNDIIVSPGVAYLMIETLIANNNKALCGSILYYQNEKNCITANSVVQCYGGGKYYPLLGKSRLHLKGITKQELTKNRDKKIDFLMGASIMVPIQAFNDIGLIPEEYFMYNEELDWQTAALQKGYKLVVCEKSELIHLDSLSTKNKKYYYYYYLNRASILFTKKYYKYFLPTVLIFRLFEILLKTSGLKNKQFSIKGIKDGFIFKRTQIKQGY